MGFSDKFAREALEAYNNDMDKAIEQATSRTAAETKSCFQIARDQLSEVESDLISLESAKDLGALDQKHIARLMDLLARASVTLDGINISGDAELRSHRRAELDLCDKLEDRITSLRSAGLENSTAAVCDGDIETCPDDVEGIVDEIRVSPDKHAHPSAMATEQRIADVDTMPLEASTYSADKGLHKGAAPVVQTEEVAADTGTTAATPLLGLPADMRFDGAEVMRLAGNEAFNSGNFGVAVARYREALSLDKEDVAINSNLAAAEIKLGDFQSAVMHADVAVRNSGGFSAKAFYRKGLALEGLQRLAEACEAYEAAVQLEPGDATMKQQLDRCRKATS